MDDATIAARLTSRESVVGAHEPSLTHVAQHFYRFVAAARGAAAAGAAAGAAGDREGGERGGGGQDQEGKKDEAIHGAAAVALQGLLAALSRYEFDVNSAGVVQGTCERELAQYASATLQVEREIASARREIEALHVELQRQRRVRRHKGECEALARVVNAHRPRHALEADLLGVRKRLGRIDAESALAAGAVAMRQRQGGLLLASLQELASLWGEEEEEEETEEGGGRKRKRRKSGAARARASARAEDEDEDEGMEEDEDEGHGRGRFEESGEPRGGGGGNRSDGDMVGEEDGMAEDGEIPE